MDETLAISPAEAARRVGISRTKMYELLATGEVPSFTLGRARRIPIDGLRRFVNEMAATAANDRGQEEDTHAARARSR